LDRTAYSDERVNHHVLRLFGLAPDRVYYFQVVSRDAAGNPAVADNNGRLFTFRTLRPLSPPFFDDMEMGTAGWTVIDGEDTQMSWRNGPPDNGTGEGAYSPVNAWGSNLDGTPIDHVDTYLVSPAINLTGGNQATLHFWQ